MKAKPDAYVHPFTLTFALYGRPCASEDVDLRAMATSGPSRSDVKCEADDKERTSRGLLGKRGMTMMVGAGESQSRAKVREEAAKSQVREANDAFKRQAIDAMSGENPDSGKMVNAIEAITKMMTRKEAREEARHVRDDNDIQFQRTLAARQEELAFLKSIDEGDTAEASKVKSDIKELFRLRRVKTATPAVEKPADTAAAAVGAGVIALNEHGAVATKQFEALEEECVTINTPLGVGDEAAGVPHDPVVTIREPSLVIEAVGNGNGVEKRPHCRSHLGAR